MHKIKSVHIYGRIVTIFDIIKMNQIAELRCQIRATDFTVVPKRRDALCCLTNLQVSDMGFLFWDKATGA